MQHVYVYHQILPTDLRITVLLYLVVHICTDFLNEHLDFFDCAHLHEVKLLVYVLEIC